jgi:hypothetical protein
VYANFAESPKGELLRILIPRNRVNRGKVEVDHAHESLVCWPPDAPQGASAPETSTS